MNATAPANLNLVMDVPVSLTIELGSCQLPMKEVLQLNIARSSSSTSRRRAGRVERQRQAHRPRRSRRGRGPLRREITEVVGSANAVAA